MSRKNLNDFLAQTLSSPDFQRAYVRASEETSSRPVRSCRCVVVEIPKTAKPHDFADITAGTVTAFVAREGEPLLGQLIKAIESNNSKDFKSAIDQIKRMEAAVFN